MTRSPAARRTVSVSAAARALMMAFALLGCAACDDPVSTTAAGGKAGAGAAQPSAAAKPKVIGVIPKGTSHLFWRSVEAGARKAGAELGVEIDWQGPPTEGEVNTQARILGDMLVKGVDAIVIAPLDKNALTRDMDEAAKRVPVVVYDSGSSFAGYKAYVATDNYRGGVLAARQMLKVLPAGAEVHLALIRYAAASESTLQREQGFLDTIRAANDARIKAERIVDQQYAGETADKATTLMANLLQADPGVNAVFASNESTARGALAALDKAGRLGKVTFIGFDSSPQLVEGLEKGQIQGLVLQDPIKMGYLATKAAVAATRGQAVEKAQPIAPTLATPENRDQPEIRQLLRPKLD